MRGHRLPDGYTWNPDDNSVGSYRNGFEVHREIGMTPQEAWEKAIEEGRSKLRSIPRDGWWELVCSSWYLHVDYAKPLVGDLPHCETF